MTKGDGGNPSPFVMIHRVEGKVKFISLRFIHETIFGLMIFPYRYKIFMRQNSTLKGFFQGIKLIILPNGQVECVIIVMKIHAVNRFFAYYGG